VSIEGERPPCKQKICECRLKKGDIRAKSVSLFPGGFPARKPSPITDLVVDQSRQGQIIEQVREKLPNVGIPILSQTLVVEPIDLGDLPRLVVTPEDGHSISVTEFQGDEQGDGLDRVVASVDVVAHEEVVGVGGVASDAEELGEVVLSERRVRGEHIVSRSSISIAFVTD
jgi:hypothetical protein